MWMEFVNVLMANYPKMEDANLGQLVVHIIKILLMENASCPIWKATLNLKCKTWKDGKPTINGKCPSTPFHGPAWKLSINGKNPPKFKQDPCPYAAIERCYPKKRLIYCYIGQKAALEICPPKNKRSLGDCPLGKRKVGNICMPIFRRPQTNISYD